MARLLILRFLALAALIFAVAPADLVAASISAQPTELHRQDLNDDDGDGIPNYLDPDDNNDGIHDEDTPVTDPVPDEETPAEEFPDPTPPGESEPSTEEPNTDSPGSTDSNDDSNAAQQPVAPQVATLPNTGVGLPATHTTVPVVIAIAMALISFLTLGAAIKIRQP